MTHAIIFEKLGMVYPDGTRAIEDIDLRIEEGEFVSLLGPSGCGKSSLLRVAAGLSEYSSGRLFVDRSQLGYTFQDATLLPWRTVQRNTEVLLELRKVPTAERQRIAREKLALVGLTGFERHYPRQLSGGMRMRASLARSFTLDPSILLFDEPFGALDEISRERLNDELIALQSKQGFTALFVTHSVSEAVFLSHRVVVMSPRPGRVLAEFCVPFEYPRNAAVRYSPEFSALCGSISKTLREATQSATLTAAA